MEKIFGPTPFISMIVLNEKRCDLMKAFYPIRDHLNQDGEPSPLEGKELRRREIRVGASQKRRSVAPFVP
jgi:hypothetical protein